MRDIKIMLHIGGAVPSRVLSAVGIALMGIVPASAQTVAGEAPQPANQPFAVVASTSIMVAPPPAEFGGPGLAVRLVRPEGRVTVGHAAIAGRPAYAARTTISGTAALVSFSNRPVPVSASFAGPVSLPALAMAHPLGRAAMTSGFGMRRHPLHGGMRVHSGVDLAAPVGTPITASSDGIVSRAEWAGGYGLLVALEHAGDAQTRYGHMSRLNVAAGQQVRKGDVIGYVGSTGNSTGPHLHYELRVNGRAVNPLR